MANRINIMKMLQEEKGLAQLSGPRPEPRPPVPPVLQVRPPRWRNHRPAGRHIIRVRMEQPADIPETVAIVFQGLHRSAK